MTPQKNSRVTEMSHSQDLALPNIYRQLLKGLSITVVHKPQNVMPTTFIQNEHMFSNNNNYYFIHSQHPNFFGVGVVHFSYGYSKCTTVCCDVI